MLFFTLKSHFLFRIKSFKQPFNYNGSVWIHCDAGRIVPFVIFGFLPALNETLDFLNILLSQLIIPFHKFLVGHSLDLILHGLDLLKKLRYSFWCLSTPVSSLDTWWFVLGSTFLVNLSLKILILHCQMLYLLLGLSELLWHHPENNFVSLD